jgi:hypothetical protein
MKLCALVFLALSLSPAAAEEIRIRNAGDLPIFRLYVWASDLTPSTESVIVFPIQSGDVETVTIDNDWSDCDFTFLIDRNNPIDIAKRNYRKKDLYVFSTNICQRDQKAIVLK